MTFLRFLLKYGLFIAMIICCTNEDGQFGINISENYHLPDYIIPMHYVLVIHFIKDDLNTVSFSGDFNASIVIHRTTQYIALHLLKYKIHVITMELIQSYEENNTVKEHKYNCSSFIYNYDTNIYVLYLKDEVPQGYYILNIKYETDISENEGFFTTSYKNQQGEKEWLLATHFQPIGARRIFPCWDEPHVRTTFEILILHNSKYTILSNNPLQNQFNTTDEALRWTYINSSALPTYLMAIAMINFPRHFNSEIIGMYCRDDIKQHVTFAWNVAKKVADHLKNEGTLLKTVNHVLIPGFLDDGISNLGLIFYRETAVVYDEQLDTIARKIKVADLIARLTIKQWFDNTIVLSSWSHLWLIKSLVTLFAVDVIDKTKIFEDNQMKYLFIEQIQYESLHLDYLQYDNFYEDSIIFNVLFLEIESPSDIKSHFSLPYYRGVCILRMLQHIITDKLFRIGINTYLHMYAQIPITFNNFWNNLYAALHLTYNTSHFNIKDIMEGWMRLWHCPVLTVTRNDARNGVLVSANPLSFTFNQSGSPNFWLPITYTMETELNFTKTSFQDIIWLKNKSIEIYVNDTDWIIVNLQQTGYYRVNYDYDIWRDIINYLHSYAYIYIHVLNRAKLIDDAFHFMITQQLNSSIFWELTHYLYQDTSYITWYPMIKAMEYMSKIFPYSNLETDAIKERLLLILDSLLLKILKKKNPEKNDLTQCLWREALKWICILNNLKCKEHMEGLQKYKFLKNNYIYQDQWIYYCVRLKVAQTDHLWTLILQEYRTYSIREALESLVCTENSKLIIKFLLRMRQNGGDIQLDRQTHIKMFFSVFARHAKNTKILELLFYNFELVTPSEVSKVALFIYIINNVYSKESLNEVEKFVKNHNHTEQIRFNVEQKIKSHLRNIEKHKSYVQTIRVFHGVQFKL